MTTPRIRRAECDDCNWVTTGPVAAVETAMVAHGAAEAHDVGAWWDDEGPPPEQRDVTCPWCEGTGAIREYI